MKEVRGMDMLQAADVYFQYEYPDEPPQKVLEGIDLTVEKGSRDRDPYLQDHREAVKG